MKRIRRGSTKPRRKKKRYWKVRALRLCAICASGPMACLRLSNRTRLRRSRKTEKTNPRADAGAAGEGEHLEPKTNYSGRRICGARPDLRGCDLMKPVF